MLIGFAGRARAGKDYCAGHAQKLLRDKAVTRGFAVELKQRVKRALTGVEGLDEAIQEKPPWMRAILQTFGENVRQADQNFWVRALMEFQGRYFDKVLLIPDVRYANEVAAIRARGGRVIKVVRIASKVPNDLSMAAMLDIPVELSQYIDPNTNPNHPSEASIDQIPDDQFDRIFFAESGMLETLERNTETALRDWGLLDD